METRKVNVLEDDEWLFLRQIIDENCPFHKEGPYLKNTEGTSFAGTRNPCYHLTLGKVMGLVLRLGLAEK